MKPSDALINQFRTAHRAHQDAIQHPSDSDEWQVWRDEAGRFQVAVTDEAAATGANRYELEMAAKAAVLHPTPDAGTDE